MADKIYKTISGDTWDSIAYKLFEDSKAYEALMDMNDKYRDVLVFSANCEIKYREVDKIKKYDEDIPPWRR